MSSDGLTGSDVAVDVQHIESRAFDGVENLITVITMVTSGVVGGFTAAIGEGVWLGVRDVVRKRKSRKQPERVIVVVVRDGPSGERRLSCHVDGERDVTTFAAAVEEIGRAGHPAAGSADLRYDVVDGTWSVDE